MTFMQNDLLPSNSFLIRGVFAIIAGTAIAVVILLFALRINEAVRVEQGELMAIVPRAVYRAPYDVTVERTLVREGDPIRPSDTLLVLQNPDVTAQYISAQEAYDASVRNHELLMGLIENATQRIARLQMQLNEQNEVLQLNKALMKSELEALAEKLAITTEQTSITHRAFSRDSTLRAKALLSQTEYERSYSTWLTSLREEQTLRSDLDSRTKQYEKLEPEAAVEASKLKMDMLNAQAELLQLQQRQVELEATIEQQRSELGARRQAFTKQYVMAEAPGTVYYLYNTKASADLVSKGDILAEVVPVENRVYARLQLRQDQVKEVAVGQRVHLKLDAYYYYKYGIIQGRVRYISSPDNQNDFYVNVDVEETKSGLELKPGYRVSAEIIQGRIPLYEFLIKRIFPARDNPNDPNTQVATAQGA